MNELVRYDVSAKDLAKGKRMKIGAWIAPIALSVLPFLIFFVLTFIFGSSPPAAITLLSLAVITGIIGLIIGLAISGFLAYRYSNWTKEMRERIAADGIRAEEIEWFMHELKSSEKKALREMQTKDLLLADAFRETLASRLTATRIVKSSKRELLLAQRRQNKLRYLKSDKNEEFQAEIKNDIEKLSSINKEAEQMLAEAQSRMQMIEAAAMRGGSLVDSELALKKLSARTQELPLALESAKMEDNIRREIENELSEKE